jgi:hypothetical protein
MHRDHDQRLPEDLARLAEELREQRPGLTALELEELRLRVQRRTGRRSTRKGSLMRSRLAIVLMIVFGAFLTIGGAGLAVSGTSGSGSAAIAQYGDDDDDKGDDDDDNGDDDDDDDSGDDDDATGDDDDTILSDVGSDPGDEQEVARAREEQAPQQQAVQPTRQAQSEGLRQLPFTGYAAIPILLIGISLLVAGVLTRLRVRADG